MRDDFKNVNLGQNILLKHAASHLLIFKQAYSLMLWTRLLLPPPSCALCPMTHVVHPYCTEHIYSRRRLVHTLLRCLCCRQRPLCPPARAHTLITSAPFIRSKERGWARDSCALLIIGLVRRPCHKFLQCNLELINLLISTFMLSQIRLTSIWRRRLDVPRVLLALTFSWIYLIPRSSISWRDHDVSRPKRSFWKNQSYTFTFRGRSCPSKLEMLSKGRPGS